MKLKLRSYIETLRRHQKRSVLTAFIIGTVGSFWLLTSEVQEHRAGHPELIGDLDLAFGNWVKGHCPKSMNAVASYITLLGSGIYLSAISGVVILILFKLRRFADIFQLILAGALASTSTALLKLHFQRPRPDSAHLLIENHSYSYPSGHSVAAASMFLTYAFIINKTLWDYREQVLVYWSACAMFLLIAASRVILGVHFFSDIVAGTLLGIAIASFAEMAKTEFEKRQS